MLDERSRASSSGLIRETTASAAPAETRDWVAEFRREQAHLIRAAPRRPTRFLSYGVGAALAVAVAAALAAALATQLPARLSGGTVPAAPAGPASAAGRPAAAELAEAREEALSFDLARARQEAETARTAHLREVEALRAAVARSEAGRERAEQERASAEARIGAAAHDSASVRGDDRAGDLARDLDTARADLAAARREAADARAEAAEGRERAEQLAQDRAEADARERERRAGGETALAQMARERDEARARLAEVALTAPVPAAASRPAPQPVDWTLFDLRLSADETPPPAARDPRRPESDRKTARRARETADRGEAAPRAGRGGRTKAGAERPPAPPGGRPAPEPRLNRPGSVEPDA